MPPVDEAPLVALLLDRHGAATAAVRAWERGDEAVCVLDPGAPAAVTAGQLRALAPTHVEDRDGRSRHPGGVPVAASVAAVVATSGTTGEPKGVELTRTGLEIGAAAYTEALDAGPGDRWLGCLPLHHVAGLATIARGWATGIPCTVHDRFDATQVAAAPDHDGATMVLVVPTMLHRLVEHGGALGRFRRVVVGAGPLDPTLRARAEATGTTVVHTYGMTEAWGGVAFDGRPLRTVELRVDDDGEVHLRTPMLMRGYRLRPDLTAAAVDADGWYRTGDVGTWDGEVLRITDRRHDLVKSGGVSVSPTAVEHVLGTHPGIADVCVVGAPDPEWGERVVAVVVPADPGAPPTVADLRAFGRDRLTDAQLPREVRVADAIPRSGSGKPLRRHLRPET